MTKKNKIPTPEELLEEAKEIYTDPNLKDYISTINTLRAKGFTWRQIAGWISERGIKCNHNEVYYLFRKNEAARIEIEESGGFSDPVMEGLSELDREKRAEDQKYRDFMQEMGEG